MAEFLLELFSEEIPARMQARAAEDLKRLFGAALDGAGLTADRLESFVTPRRLVLVADGLPTAQPDVTEERKGPKADAPQQAIDGFLKATGLTLDQCERRETPKGPVWYAVSQKQGEATETLLPRIAYELICNLSWPKSMRWNENRFRWVRPLHRILAIYEGKPVNGLVRLGRSDQETATIGFASHTSMVPTIEDQDYEVNYLEYGNITSGHRFLAPDPVEVTSFADYREKLRNAYVVLDREERKALILDQATNLAAAEKLALKDDPGLLEEVTGLVEYPVALIGRIDDAFMELPAEVLTTSMRSHQKYFACQHPDGSLAPRFVVVANMVTEDVGATVVAGNEKVLRARLSDARFFWDQDRKIPLGDRVKALAAVTFHEKLGSMEDKVARMEALAGDLAAAIPGCDADQARRAARLAKADLTTGMVGEFPELQGLMGGYYATGQGEPPAVAEAVAQHYSPLGPNDRCPTAPVAIAVALADKIDTLAGFFAIDEKPTGSRDPYALRRAALGIIRLIVENGVRLSLGDALKKALRPYPASNSGDAVADDLLAFFADRLKVALRDRGVRHDLIDAVFALGGEDDLVRLLARVEALGAFLGTDDGANLLVAYRRAANIFRIESKKDGRQDYGAVNPALLGEAEEKSLHAALAKAHAALEPLLAAEDFVGAMAALAALRTPVDSFFDKVTVNADDPALRVNRLALLADITGTMNRVADFSRVEG
ncbi:glycine--tRNA ligase subunit beta [Inquilinus sp. CAU 1745]|uniref:glycine--tRNA ligase subunit beta n=1 Tax=Inquilinus sp. CAU 1745 TaxID=3140369 RepID=UPI00325B20E9